MHGGSPVGAAETAGLTLGFFAVMALAVRPLLARLLAPGPGQRPDVPDSAVLPILLGGAMAARAAGLDWPESASLGVLMNCRGLTGLIVLNVGLDLKVITPTMFTMLVLMALVTTALTGPGLALVRRLDRAGAAARRG